MRKHTSTIGAGHSSRWWYDKFDECTPLFFLLRVEPKSNKILILLNQPQKTLHVYLSVLHQAMTLKTSSLSGGCQPPFREQLPVVYKTQFHTIRLAFLLLEKKIPPSHPQPAHSPTPREIIQPHIITKLSWTLNCAV